MEPKSLNLLTIAEVLHACLSLTLGHLLLAFTTRFEMMRIQTRSVIGGLASFCR